MHRPLGDPWVFHVYSGSIVTLGEGVCVCTDHWVTHGYSTYTLVLYLLRERVSVCAQTIGRPMGIPRILWYYSYFGRGCPCVHRPLGDPWVFHVYSGTIYIVTLGEGARVHWVTHGYSMYTIVITGILHSKMVYIYIELIHQ